MELIDFQKIYHPLWLHFTSDYNVFKYGYKVKSYPSLSNDTLIKLVARSIDNPTKALKICISNFAYRNSDWIYDNDYSTTINVYTNWLRKTKSLKETIKNDYEIFETAKREGKSDTKRMLCKTERGNLPPIIQLVMSNYISREFVCLLDDCNNFIDDLSNEYGNDPLVRLELFKLKKYQPFVKTILNEQEKKSN